MIYTLPWQQESTFQNIANILTLDFPGSRVMSHNKLIIPVSCNGIKIQGKTM